MGSVLPFQGEGTTARWCFDEFLSDNLLALEFFVLADQLDLFIVVGIGYAYSHKLISWLDYYIYLMLQSDFTSEPARVGLVLPFLMRGLFGPNSVFEGAGCLIGNFSYNRSINNKQLYFK